jgi:electron transfer flavoprotein alpha subunit
MSNELWVICEAKENIITKASCGLLTAAKRLASEKGIVVAAIVMSQLDGEEIQKLREFGAEKIYIYAKRE